MMQPYRFFTALLTLGLFTVFLAPVYAVAAQGGSAVMIDDGERIKIEYSGTDKLRITSDSDDGYMIMRDNKMYTVMQQGGQTMVFDLTAAIASMNKMLDQESVWDEEIQDVLELSNTGKSEMVAGISGEVFTMTYVDGQGQKQTSTMVLSQEDHIVALARAMNAMTKLMITASGRQLPPSVTKMEKQILDQGYGVLRQGSEFVITKSSATTPPASYFELPAKPMQLPGM
ncbi:MULTISPECIES: hypothetical protein [Idiomarina]|uniref:hypothetical protein n=1 Tax=Idiomarinaceae TaxID=267893 RepID=UPI00129C454B|nr:MULTISPECIES: hypothetical protein [Idiomarina]MRJ42219.1 hypothetical protein [Idiomarina sp. FeN1]NCU57145.1 hypothetical protein [Idiomarina sp. FenA--70]NCU59854.1 hypothetical protein [Idiomarina sp. FenBw--71]UUN13157.1 hypothetical protein KGF88_11055 [Idiomarina loihiensis]